MKAMHTVLLAAAVSALVSAGTTTLVLKNLEPGAVDRVHDFQNPGPYGPTQAAIRGTHHDFPARVHGTSPSLAAMRDGDPAEGAGSKKSPQELRLDSEQRFKQIHQSFKAEPVSPAWAKNTESMVRDAFASEDAIAMGVQVPLQATIECRSSRCRIATVYDSEGAAVDAAQMLQMDIAGTLPRTQVMTFAQPDGTTQLVIYADSTPLPAAKPVPPRG
ncbi:hypothetical protein [Luteimonas mephitis]|uniref:hypothetical protein n=1 Tax=Luteimonas mephitis TaxID=83615 RepID=UPI003A8DCE21